MLGSVTLRVVVAYGLCSNDDCCEQHWLPVFALVTDGFPPPPPPLPPHLSASTVQCVLGWGGVVVQHKLLRPCVCVCGWRETLFLLLHTESEQKHGSMMSDSPASLPFLPSLWVFPHSAGRSWVFLQADTGHLRFHSSTRHSHGATSPLKAAMLPIAGPLCGGRASAELPARGGEAGDGPEYVRIRK